MSPDTTLPNADFPVTLEEQDGSNKTGIPLCGPSGEDDILAISRDPFPRTGLKISQAATQYSDESLPYVTTHQDDFSGGRGAEKFESDKTRLADAFRAIDFFPEMVFPGNQEHFSTGQGQVQTQYWHPTGRTHGTTTFTNTIKVAKKFTTPAAVAAAVLTIQMEWFTAPTDDVVIDIYTDSGGSPDALQENFGTISAASILHGIHTYSLGKTLTLSDATTYWIVIYMSGSTDTGTILMNAADTTTQATKRYSGSWSLVSGEVYFRWFHHWYTWPDDSTLFTYKGGLYCNIFDKVYINGDRGVADVSGSGHDLEDSTKTGWTADQWNGCVLYVFRGTGAGNYFTIADSDQGWLDFDFLSSWIAFDTTTEYVILGSNEWQEVWDIGSNYFPTDIVVAGEYVYFAFNKLVQVKRYNCYNAAGTYTERNATETVYADKLAVTYNSGEKKYYLWGSYDDAYKPFVLWKMGVPPFWGALYRDQGELSNFESPWDDFDASNREIAKSATEDDEMVIAIDAAFGTGRLAEKILDTPINLTKGQAIAFAIKSDVACSAADLSLVLSQDEVAYNLPLGGSNFTTRLYKAVALQYQTGDTTFADVEEARDGDVGTGHTFTTFTTAHYVYIGSSKPFNRIYITMGGTVNAVTSVMTLEIHADKGQFVSTTITDGTASSGKTLAQSGEIQFTAPDHWKPVTIESSELYWARFKVSVNLTASIIINLVRTYFTYTTIDLPALTANVWTWVVISGTFLQYPFPNESAITDLVLFLNTDLGAQNIYLRGSVRIIEPVAEFIVSFTSRITSITPYGSDVSNPYVLLEEGKLVEVQTQNSDAVVPIPLDELKALASPVLGKYATTSDVYLYFSAGERIERYHEQQMENVGPDADNGLPADRAGNIHGMVSAPGGILFASVDGPTGSSGPTRRSILMRKGGGWHEIYRSPRSELPSLSQYITSMLFQSIPGQLNRLWFMQGRDTGYIEIPLSRSDDSQDYLIGSSFITPWISVGFLDVQKRLMELKEYTKNLSASDKLRVFWQLESGDEDDPGDWTEMASAYTTSPFETQAMSADYSTAARRLRLKHLFYNVNPTTRPELYSWILSAILALDVRYLYTLRVRLSDNPQDLRGILDKTSRAETLQAQLDSWLSSPPTVLTMKSIYSTMGGSTGKKVIVNPYPFKPYRFIRGPKDQEYLVADIQVLEVV